MELVTRGATRWSTTLSSKVNLSHAINFRSLCGANLVTKHPRIWSQRNLRTSPYGGVERESHFIETGSYGRDIPRKIKHPGGSAYPQFRVTPATLCEGVLLAWLTSSTSIQNRTYFSPPGSLARCTGLQGYLAHKKQWPPRTLQ